MNRDILSVCTNDCQLNNLWHTIDYRPCADSEKRQGVRTHFHWKITSGYSTDQPRDAIGPIGSNCFSREIRTALCEIH